MAKVGIRRVTADSRAGRQMSQAKGAMVVQRFGPETDKQREQRLWNEAQQAKKVKKP